MTNRAADIFSNAGYRSERLQFQTRLYVFACVFRNCCINKYVVNLCAILVDIFLLLVPLCQPINYNAQRYAVNNDIPSLLNNPFNDQTKRIWSVGYIINQISPKLLSTNFILLCNICFIIFILATFLLCIVHPFYVRKLRFTFLYILHVPMFHFCCSCFGFCIEQVSEFAEDLECSILSLFFIIFFFLYFLFFTFLSFLESNSIIRPNNPNFEWFHGFSFYSPFLLFVYSCIGFNAHKIDHFVFRLAIYSFQAVVALIVTVYIIQTHPYQYELTNDFQASRHLTVFFYSIFAIITNFYPYYLVTLFLSSLPIFYCLILYIVHILNEKRRASFIQINNQLDTIENLTYDAIRLGLSSLKSETQIRMVIKYGFITGSRTIISSPFIKYIIENYPDSNWIVSFVIFLYATIWGTDQMTYKFFLHFLSINKFGPIPEFLLFQNVYCYMQCSETLSPIIKRYLDDYRENFLMNAQEHKYFWSHASKTNSLMGFQEIIQNFAYSFANTQRYLLDLKAMFPYNPSVLYEMAIFEADFKHNIRKSSHFFNKAHDFASNGIKTISNKLFSDFEIISSTTKRKSFVPEKDPIEYSFLSILENHDRAQRNAVFFNTNDKYIKRLSNTFTAKADTLPQYTTFFHSEICCLFSIFFLMLSSFLVLLYVHFHMVRVLKDESSHYSYVQEMIEQTLLFRHNLALSFFDILLISTIQSRELEDLTKQYIRGNDETPDLLSDDYFWHAVKHLNVSGEETSKYTYYYYDIINQIDIPYDYVNNSIYSRFDTDFYDYHRTVYFFIQSRSITEFLFNPNAFSQIVLSLEEISRNIYHCLNNHIQQYASDILDSKKKSLIILVLADILFALILGACLYFTFQNYFKKIYSIVNTIQPPALRVISEQFDKLMTLQSLPTKKFRSYSIFRPIVFYISGILIQIFLPLIFYTTAINDKKTTDNSQGSLPTVPFINKDSKLIYYTFAMIEYRLESNSSFISSFNSTMIDDFLGLDPFCMHHILNPLEVTESSYNINLLIIVSFVITFISLIFFVLFIMSIIRDIDYLKSIRIIFYFIGGQWQQTNPVLSIYNGQQISNELVNSFSHFLKKPPTKFDFFVSLAIDDDYSIVSRIGNLQKLFNDCHAYAIRTLEDLKTFLNENAKIHEKFGIEEFFEKRVLNKPFFFSFPDGIELSMKFISPYELFFKDETYNSEFSKKRILMQQLAEYSEKHALPNIDNKLVVLLILDKIKTENQMKIILLNAMKYEQSGLLKIDTRNNRFVFILTISDDNQTIASKIIFNFLNDCSEILPEVVCAVDFGPISLLNTTKSPMVRSRVVGSLFDVLSVFASSVKIGTIYLMKPFLEISNFENFPRTNGNDIAIELNTYKVTDSILVQAAHFSIDLIKFMI